MATTALTKANFEESILGNDIVLVDFWASWCGPCKMFAPVYERVSNDNPDVLSAKIDTEAEQELAAAFGVQSIPTVAAFRSGILLFQQAGALPDGALTQLVGELRKLDMEEVRAKLEEIKDEDPPPA